VRDKEKSNTDSSWVLKRAENIKTKEYN
jgi:hypothetical protein